VRMRLFITLILLLGTFAAGGSGAPAEVTEDKARRVAEGYLRGDVDELKLAEMAESLTLGERIRLYLLSRQLRPYFKPIENAVRELARTSPEDHEAVSSAYGRVRDVMRERRAALLSSGRAEAHSEWERGLLALVLLDKAWRKRNLEAGDEEVRNPFDTARLFETLDREFQSEQTDEENVNAGRVNPKQ